jgi:lysine 2,3-aminomutase
VTPDGPRGTGGGRSGTRHAPSRRPGARPAPHPRGARGGARAMPRAGPAHLRSRPTTSRSCDRSDPACPVRLQCVPRVEEAARDPGRSRGPARRGRPRGRAPPGAALPRPRAAPGRPIAAPSTAASARARAWWATAAAPVSLDALEPAIPLDLEQHPEIRDVIVSGGDPMAMATDKPRRASSARLRRIESIDTIRLATRVPVTLPQRDHERAGRARCARCHPLWVMTHFNHPKELTPGLGAACRASPTQASR